MSKRWRMAAQCADCPFATSGAGLALRKSLQPGRFASIKRDLLCGEYFVCHKTSRETGDGSHMVCAGALEFQESHGVSSNYQRVCERIEAMVGERPA